MRSENIKKSLRLKIALFAAVLVLITGLLVMAGCSSYGFVPSIPGGHYEGSGTAHQINYEHSRCGACHEGTTGAFSMNGADSYTVHADAWAAYINNSDMDADVKQQILDNQENMEKYFAASDTSSCISCHETSVQAAGFVTGEINIDEFCAECHSQEDIIAATADWDEQMGANPHQSHVNAEEDVTCNSCHQFHSSADTLFCNECHDFALPEGWIAPPTAPEPTAEADAPARDED